MMNYTGWSLLLVLLGVSQSVQSGPEYYTSNCARTFSPTLFCVFITARRRWYRKLQSSFCGTLRQPASVGSIQYGKVSCKKAALLELYHQNKNLQKYKFLIPPFTRLFDLQYWVPMSWLSLFVFLFIFLTYFLPVDCITGTSHVTFRTGCAGNHHGQHMYHSGSSENKMYLYFLNEPFWKWSILKNIYHLL